MSVYSDEFQYSDQEEFVEDAGGDVGAEDPSVRVQNSYYSARELKVGDPEGALAEFRKVIEAAAEAGGFEDWVFKAAKNVCKMLIRLGRLPEFLTEYRALLDRVKRCVASASGRLPWLQQGG